MQLRTHLFPGFILAVLLTTAASGQTSLRDNILRPEPRSTFIKGFVYGTCNDLKCTEWAIVLIEGKALIDTSYEPDTLVPDSFQVNKVERIQKRKLFKEAAGMKPGEWQVVQVRLDQFLTGHDSTYPFIVEVRERGKLYHYELKRYGAYDDCSLTVKRLMNLLEKYFSI